MDTYIHQKEKNTVMNKATPFWQLLTVGVTLLIFIVTSWVTLNNKVTDQNARLTNMEIQQDKMQSQFQSTLQRLEDKLDIQNEQLTQVRILLENKANRK